MTSPGPADARPGDADATDAGPIEGATIGLVAWLGSAAGAPVRVGPPVDAGPAGISMWPYGLRAEQQLSTGTGGASRHPYRFVVRYVVAATSADGTDSLALLDLVLTAAVRAGAPAVALEALDAGVWSALGARPRPVILVEVPVMIGHDAVDEYRVRAPLQLRQTPLRPLRGTVLGPDDQPISALPVEVVGTPMRALTDHRGRFRFVSVPGDRRVALRMSGRGRTFTATVDLNTLAADEPVVIRCDLRPDIRPESRPENLTPAT